MAIHSLYPGFVKTYYTSNGHTHVMTMPVIPQNIPMVPGSTPNLLRNDGTYGSWQDEIAKITAHLIALYPTTATFTRSEIFGMASKTGDPFYVSGTTIVGGSGTNGGAVVPFSLATITLRTNAGGIVKMCLMESCLLPNQEYTAPSFGGITELAALVNHLLGSDNVVMGRDGGEPMASIMCKTKTSDALRKRYL